MDDLDRHMRETLERWAAISAEQAERLVRLERQLRRQIAKDSDDPAKREARAERWWPQWRLREN